MEMSEEVKNLFASLSKAEGAMEAVKKKGSSDVGYNYGKLEDIIEVSKKPLADNELAVIQMPSEGDENCSVMTMITHSSGEWIRDTLKMPVIIPMSNQGKPMMNHAQAVGNVITYCRRYSIAAFLNIAQEDTDAQGGEGGAKKHVNTTKKASEKQVKFIKDLVQQKWNVNDFRAKFGVMAASELTSPQAKEAIDFIQNMTSPAGLGSVAESPKKDSPATGETKPAERVPTGKPEDYIDDDIPY